MRNRLVFPSAGMETKYVWDRHSIQNNGIYIWDTHDVIQDDVYYWDKYAIAGKSSYTWDKYNVIETPHYTWNKYGVTETTDYAWNYWKCSWKDVYFVFTTTTYELEAQADYNFTDGYLHFYKEDGSMKSYSVASIIANNASLGGLLAAGFYGFRYSTASVIYNTQPNYLVTSLYSELYVENGAVVITNIEKIKTGALSKFSSTKPANLDYDYVETPYVSYPNEIIDTYTAVNSNAYPINDYATNLNYYYELQNDGFWNTAATGIVADKSSVIETYTSTDKNAYTAGLYPTYLLEYAGETIEYSKGTTHSGTVSSSDGGAYPKDGYKNGIWYVMQLSGNYVWNTYNTAPVQTWDRYKAIDSNQLISATGTKQKLAEKGLIIKVTYYGYFKGDDSEGQDIPWFEYYGSPYITEGVTISGIQNTHLVSDTENFKEAYVKSIWANATGCYFAWDGHISPESVYHNDPYCGYAPVITNFYNDFDLSIQGDKHSTDNEYTLYIYTDDSKLIKDSNGTYTITNLIKLSIAHNLNEGATYGYFMGTLHSRTPYYPNDTELGIPDTTPLTITNSFSTNSVERQRVEDEIGDTGEIRGYEVYTFKIGNVTLPYGTETEVTVDSSYSDYEAIKEAVAIMQGSSYGINGYAYAFSDIEWEKQIGDKYGSVTSTDRNAYPDDGALNGYWYVHSGVTPDATTFIGTVESRDKDAYPQNDAVDGVYYVFSHLEDDTIVKGDLIEPVSSSNKNAFPQDNVSGDYWYVYSHMTTDYFCGDKNGTVNAETINGYPANAKKGSVWYVYSHFENNGPYKSRWVDEVETNLRSVYPTNGIQGNYWYVYKKSYQGYKLQINDEQLRGRIDYKHNVNPEKDFTIGCVASAEIDFEYDNTKDDFQQYLDEDYCDYYTWQPNDETWRLIGRFWLTDAVYNRNLVSVKAFDAILAADTYVDDFIAQTVFPITLTNFYNSLCNFLGVTGSISSRVVNRTVAFADNFEAINITARQLFQYIAEMAGGFIKAEPNGTLYLTTYVSSGVALDKSHYTSYAKQRYNIEPISGLTVRMNSDDLGVSSGDVETNPYIIENNPLFYAESTSEIQAPVNTLYSSISTKVYRPATIQLLQDFGINCGDIITVNEDTFYVMNKELSASGCKLECFGNQYRDKQPSSINSDIVALRGKTNELYRDLEKTQSTLTDTAAGLQSQITQTAQEINLRVTNEVEGLESQITQNAESIELRVTNEVAGLESKITQTADSITSSVEDKINETKSEIKQTTDSISLQVDNQGELVAQLVLDVDGINARGYVTFTDLAGSGTTVINGDNITTGTINADRINMRGAISWADLSDDCQDTVASYAGVDGSDAEVPSYIKDTYIARTEIRSPTIYGATIYAGLRDEGYCKMTSSGLNVVSDTGGNICGIGWYPGYYNLPYVVLGAGVDNVGTDQGLIKKYTHGIWIGDSDSLFAAEEAIPSSGTGIFVDFVEGKIYKYINGTKTAL